MLATMVEHVIGIDPDRDWVTASVVDTATTGEQTSEVFETTQAGYDRLLKWADQCTHTAGRVWSVEGTGSYGAGVAAYLIARDELVVEFNHLGYGTCQIQKKGRIHHVGHNGRTCDRDRSRS